MTGMKEGAGEDPFAEDSSTDSMEDTEREPAAATEIASQEPTSAETEAPDPDTASSDTTDTTASISIPYKFRRDGVQDGRDRVPLFLKGETKDAEREALREFEDRFDDDVSLTDLREAVVMVGLDHLDEVEDVLEGWGYGMTFDE